MHHAMAYILHDGQQCGCEKGPHLEGGKGAKHVKGVHQLLVLGLTGTLRCLGSHLALLTLALLLQAGVRILNVCTSARSGLNTGQ